MPRNTEEVEIEGVKYTIRQVGGFDGLRLKAMVIKQLTEPVARALASATSIAELLKMKLGDGDGDDAESKEGSGSWLDNPALRDLLVEAIPGLGDALSPEYLVAMAKLMIFGNVKGALAGELVEIEDEGTYSLVIAQGSPLHDFLLLKECMRVNLGPIFADRPMTQAGTDGRRQPTQ